MKQISPLLKIAIRFGILGGALGAVLVIILYYIGKHPLLFPIYFDFRIILFSVFIYFVLREYRDFIRGGILYFWEGILGSIVFVTVYALVASMAIYMFGNLVPEFVTSFITLFTDQVKSFPKDVVEQIGKENIQRNLEQLTATDSYWLAKNYFDQSFIISFFVSIILSVILRRQPKN